jgi:hypothetical protein
VPEITLYRYARYAAEGLSAQKHGNSGLLKLQTHIVQAMAALRCIFDRSLDHMPHRIRTIVYGKKVVSKVLPTT